MFQIFCILGTSSISLNTPPDCLSLYPDFTSFSYTSSTPLGNKVSLSIQFIFLWKTFITSNHFCKEPISRKNVIKAVKQGRIFLYVYQKFACTCFCEHMCTDRIAEALALQGNDIPRLHRTSES